MKEVLEYMIGVIFFVLLIGASINCVSAAVDARNADKMKIACIKELEDSNFSTSVMNKVFTDVEKEGYKVAMVVYSQLDGKSTKTSIASANDIIAKADNLRGAYMVKVVIGFNYTFPIMNITARQTLIGYAK